MADLYIHIETGEYPVYKARIERNHPNTIFGKNQTDFTDQGYALVQKVEKPEADVVQEGEPEFSNGAWQQTWIARSFTSEELQQNAKSEAAAKRKEIEVDRDASLVDPDASADVGGVTFQTDPKSMTQLNDALTVFTALGSVPPGYEWRDADNVNHPADLTFLASIAAARADQVNQVWQLSWSRKAALDAIDLTSPDAINQIRSI